jgi:uncharacterized protein YbjQ (UPF0145 family)
VKKSDRCGIGSLSAGFLLTLTLTLTGCASVAAAPSGFAAYELDAAHGAVDKTLGTVKAISCFRSDGKNAGSALALSRLQARAAALGANAVIDVTYTSFTDVPKSPCWRRTVARGVAVVLRPAAAASAG